MRIYISGLTSILRTRGLPLTGLCFVVLGSAVVAQDVDFQIANISLEQVIVAEQQAAAQQGSTNVELLDIESQSSSVILQAGDGNSANLFSNSSLGSAAVAYQIGQLNTAQSAILDSPASIIAQFQLGEANNSDVVISGGRDNAISTVQIGNRLGVSVGLVNSEGTTVIYGQAGDDYNGSVVFENAPRGTVITLN